MNTNTNIAIVNDYNAELQPGMIVTAQLGNPGDVDWSPCAPLLLLHTNVIFFGEQQFTGLYKRANGELYVARFLTKSYLRRNADEGNPEEACEIGMMYCTSAVPVEEGEYRSRYLGAGENETLATAMRHHRAKIEALPVAYHYKNGVCLDQVETV